MAKSNCGSIIRHRISGIRHRASKVGGQTSWIPRRINATAHCLNVSITVRSDTSNIPVRPASSTKVHNPVAAHWRLYLDATAVMNLTVRQEPQIQVYCVCIAPCQDMEHCKVSLNGRSYPANGSSIEMGKGERRRVSDHLLRRKVYGISIPISAARSRRC